MITKECPFHSLDRQVWNRFVSVAQIFAGDAAEGRLSRARGNSHGLEKELAEGKQHDPHGEKAFDILAHGGVRVGLQRGLCCGFQPGHRCGDVITGAALLHAFQMADGCFQLGDACRRQEIPLVVQELLGLFGQVARFPIAFPEYVAEW